MHPSHKFPARAVQAALLLLTPVPLQGQENNVELVAYWPFEEDYTSLVNPELYDGQPQGGDFTRIATEEEIPVRGIGALELDSGPQAGEQTYVDVDNEFFPQRHEALSIVCWYRYDDISGDGSNGVNTVFEVTSAAAMSYALHLDDDRRDGEWIITGLAGRQLENDDGPIVNDGKWHHLAMIWDEPSLLARIYHDGKLRDVPPTTLFPPLAAARGLHIGNDAIGGSSRVWDGYIDDVAVFDGALTSSQVAALYQGDATPLTVNDVEEPPPPQEFPELAPGAWTMVIIPDTQKYTQSTHFSPLFTVMTEWIRDHRDERNIAIALHVGDLTDDNDDDDGIQWERAIESMSVLDGVIPYVLATGNHDHGPGGNASTRDTLLNDYFNAAQNPLNDPQQGGILAGTMEPDQLQNAYYDFTAPDGRKFLILSLEWGPRQEVVEWANGIAAMNDFRNHLGVLLTHSYLYTDGVRHNWAVFEREQTGNPHRYPTADLPGGVSDGEELWNNLVKLHANFKLTFNGHTARASLGDKRTGVGFLTEQGVDGNLVHQMLFNAQHIGGNGGGGWIRLLEFTPEGRVQVKTFSPFLEAIGEDPWRRENFDQFSFLITDPLSGSDARVDDDLALDWLYSSWFGFYNISAFPWIYSNAHGFLYQSPQSEEDSIFFFDYVIDSWLYSSAEIYPFLYFFDGQGWVYFFDEPSGRRHFFRFSDQTTVTFDRAD